jgi:hypothetical protein
MTKRLFAEVSTCLVTDGLANPESGGKLIFCKILCYHALHEKRLGFEKRAVSPFNPFLAIFTEGLHSKPL